MIILSKSGKKILSKIGDIEKDVTNDVLFAAYGYMKKKAEKSGDGRYTEEWNRGGALTFDNNIHITNESDLPFE